MAETLKLPPFVAKLISALSRKMPGSGTDVQRVPGTNRYRIAIVWSGFPKRNVRKRQDSVWKIAEEVLGDEELLRISMILTLHPDEVNHSK